MSVVASKHVVGGEEAEPLVWRALSALSADERDTFCGGAGPALADGGEPLIADIFVGLGGAATPLDIVAGGHDASVILSGDGLSVVIRSDLCHCLSCRVATREGSAGVTVLTIRRGDVRYDRALALLRLFTTTDELGRMGFV